MQLADVLCYIFLTITVTASCSRAEDQAKEVGETEDGKRISKREATLILDLNSSTMDKIFQKPKVIYRRISKTRYRPPKTKFGSLKPKYGPPRPKHRPSKVNRKPGKKGRTGKPQSSSPKYGPPEARNTQYRYIHKKRASKNKDKYGVPKLRPNGRPGFGHVLKMPHYSFHLPDKASFGEPPAHLVKHQTLKQSYGEPPVDSYGAPLKPSINDIYPSPHSFQESSPHDDIHDFTKQEYEWNYKYPEPDTGYAFTKKEPTFSNFVTPIPKESHEDSLDPVGKDKHIAQDNIKFFFRKKKPFYLTDSKVMSKPWKPNNPDEFDDEIIVGGQYAEPPARFMPKIRQHPMIYDDEEDEESLPALQGYVDTDAAISANNSPYSNYKHSNMAFSPQNLNDAFSIVDK